MQYCSNVQFYKSNVVTAFNIINLMLQNRCNIANAQKFNNNFQHYATLKILLGFERICNIN